MNSGIKFEEPIWQCRICRFKSTRQFAPDTCPQCKTRFSMDLIKPITHILDEHRKEIEDKKHQRNPGNIYGRKLGEKEYRDLQRMMGRADRY